MEKLEKFKDYSYLNHENIEEGDEEIIMISLENKEEENNNN